MGRSIKSAGQRLVLAGAAFALEEAARDLAGRIRLLDVVHGQRKEVLTGLGLGASNDGGEHDGALHVEQDGARGLASDLAGLHRDRVAAPLEGLGVFLEQAHVQLLGGGTRSPEHDAIPAPLRVSASALE
jgi:hypothetical protein